MATATFAATTLCHGSADAWNTAGTARQGIYAASDSSMKTPRTGIMYYSGMGTALKNKHITNISIAYTLGGSGGAWAKTIRFVESNYQTAPTKSGSPYPGSYVTGAAEIGTYDLSNGGAHSSTITLNQTTNSSLFYKFAQYLESGANIICIHSTDTGNKSGYAFSTNYLEISKFTITVTYHDTYPLYINSEGSTQYLDVTINYPFTSSRSPVNVSAVPENYFEYWLPSETEVIIYEDGDGWDGHYVKSMTLWGAGSISGGQGESVVMTGSGEASVDVYWELVTYTITYNANGKTVNNLPTNQIKTYGTDLRLSSTVPEIKGSTTIDTPEIHLDGSWTALQAKYETKYHFMSWNTAANGSGTSYRPGDTFKLNSNTTLYLISGTSRFFQDIYLPVLKKPGYKFLGWTTGRSNAGYINFHYTDQLYPYTGSGRLLPDQIDVYAYEMLDGTSPITHVGGYKTSDAFVFFEYDLNDREELVPVIYKTDVDEYDSTDVDWEDPFYYEGRAELQDGTVCDKWRKVSNHDWNNGTVYVYTNTIVDRLPEKFSSVIPFDVDRDADVYLSLYSVWKSNGITYIDTGSQMVPHTIWIDTGSEWKQYIAYIDTGSEWHMCGAAE